MATFHRVARRLQPSPFTKTSPLSFKNSSFQVSLFPQSRKFPLPLTHLFVNPIPSLFSLSKLCTYSTGSAFWTNSSQWFTGKGDTKPALPDIVLAGDPVLHEAASEVVPEQIGSEKIQKIIDDMVAAMRKVPCVGLSAPQIGYPFRIIVLEDTPRYISYVTKETAQEQERHPFDLLVIVNPKLEKKGTETALFFEGCVSVVGHEGLVERDMEVEVTGFGRDGEAMRKYAWGWQARILQHECDHLDGFLYVDRMAPRTFRALANTHMPLANGCPKIGVRINEH